MGCKCLKEYQKDLWLLAYEVIIDAVTLRNCTYYFYHICNKLPTVADIDIFNLRNVTATKIISELFVILL